MREKIYKTFIFIICFHIFLYFCSEINIHEFCSEIFEFAQWTIPTWIMLQNYCWDVACEWKDIKRKILVHPTVFKGGLPSLPSPPHPECSRMGSCDYDFRDTMDPDSWKFKICINRFFFFQSYICSWELDKGS